MIKGWILGGVLCVSALVIMGRKGYIENKEHESDNKKWRAYVYCIRNHEQVKGLDLESLLFYWSAKGTPPYWKAKCNDFDFTKFDINEFLKYLNELQRLCDLRKLREKEEQEWRIQNPHIFKNHYITMNLNDVSFIEYHDGNKKLHYVHLKNGKYESISSHKCNGLMQQFAKHISKKETI